MSYFDGPKSSKNWYARLEYSYSQSASTTTITLTLKVYDATGLSYNNNNNSAYYVIQGDKTYQKYSFDSAGWYTIGSKTVKVSDTSATSLYVSAQWVSGNETTYTPASLSVSGTVTFPQIAPPPPSVNVISVQPIPKFIAGYDGDSFTITCTPSGGTGYTYKWYKGDIVIGTSQTIKGTLDNSTYDNTSVYCVVVDATGGTATTNKCEFRVGTTASQIHVPAKRTKTAWVCNENQFLCTIPFIYDEKWLYVGWKIIEITPLPLWADTRLSLVDSVSGMVHPVVDTSAHHNIPLTMYFPKAQILSVSHSAAEQTLSMTVFIPEAQNVKVHPLMAERAISLIMTIPPVRSMVLNPFTMNQDFDMTMHIPSARGVVLNPLTLTQASPLTMTIPRGQGVELHSVTAQQAMTARLSAADVVDITISPGQVSQAEPLTMRASGVPVQVMSDAVDHVLPSMVGDISPEVLTAQDAAAPERVELAMSAEAKAIYPRFVQRGDIVYIYRPMRCRQEGDTVYLDYTEAAWEAPEEDGDALIVRQVYSAAENGDYLEVT